MVLDELTFAGPFRIAQLRYDTALEDAFRECRSPGDDLSDLPPDVQAAIEAEWTPPIIAAYQALVNTPPDPPTAEQLRVAALLALGPVVALEAVLRTADGHGIDAWADANANSLPEIRTTLRTVLKLLAARLR